MQITQSTNPSNSNRQLFENARTHSHAHGPTFDSILEILTTFSIVRFRFYIFRFKRATHWAMRIFRSNKHIYDSHASATSYIFKNLYIHALL